MEHITTSEIAASEIDWKRANEYFKGYTHIDVKNIPEIYQDYVMPMRDVIMEDAILKIKYGVTEVLGKSTIKGANKESQGVSTRKTEEDLKKEELPAILLENEQAFTGKVIGQAYKDAKKIILYVTSVTNIDELMAAHPDRMESFFLDYWAVAVLNATREQYYDRFQQELVEEGDKMTYVWSPGQSNFALENQAALFALLEPEEIGVHLDRFMRMNPFQSVSGTIGIVEEHVTDLLISCDLCNFAKKCPGYKGKKYRDITMENRRL